MNKSLNLNKMISFKFFIARIASAAMNQSISRSEIIKYFDEIISGSFGIVIFCVGSAAVVTVLESIFHMDLVLNETSMVPGFSSLVIVRELGPVVTGLLIASLTGTGWAAETAIMTATEQIDAMRLLGIDPYQKIVLPRIIASSTALMILSVIATVSSLIFTMVISVYIIKSPVPVFIDSIRILLSSYDIVAVMIKGFIFGLIISLSACYHGLHEIRNPSDAGYASTRALVSSTVYIIFLDFILNWITSAMY